MTAKVNQRYDEPLAARACSDERDGRKCGAFQRAYGMQLAAAQDCNAQSHPPVLLLRLRQPLLQHLTQLGPAAGIAALNSIVQGPMKEGRLACPRRRTACGARHKVHAATTCSLT